MARLNEPVVSSDSLELLRRKFLRQNKEIAKINSNQSVRIRDLENDMARLLSENLDLRSQVMRLEKELEDVSAQRIADYALEVKAKMEAHVAELGSLLAGLGMEPPAKRHSPARRKFSEAKANLGRSPRQRRLRDVAKDQEALAMQEGRLPPIQESKLYPRPTLNDEIQALRSELTDAADSPDIGPPPTSIFVDDISVKVESPSKATDAMAEEADETEPNGNEVTEVPETHLPPPKLYLDRKPTQESEPTLSHQDSDFFAKDCQTDHEASPPITLQVSMAGSKRKFGDGNESNKVVECVGATSSVGSPEKPEIRSEAVKETNIKALPSSGRAQRGEPSGQGANPRRALAAKSTNEDVMSPKKRGNEAAADMGKPVKPHASKRNALGGKTRQRKTPTPLAITEMSAPQSAVASTEPMTPPPGEPLALPKTPDNSSATELPHDTPPPADISPMGEASRPSRRARAAISYAEPNLRDKMRRPTKELVDAVAGEGKHIPRSGQATRDSMGPASASRPGSEARLSASWRNMPASEALAKESARRQSVSSPLATKDSIPGAVPAVAAAEVTGYASSVAARGSPASLEQSVADKDDVNVPDESASAIGSASAIEEGDVYDFTSSSPVSVATESRDGQGGERITMRQRTKNSTKPPTSAKDMAPSPSNIVPPPRSSRASTARKRSSMVAPKQATLLEPQESEDSPADDEGPMAKGRVSRRRSMML